MQKKIVLLNSLEGEQSAAVADFYVKGFLQMLADKIFTIAPDLHRTMILNKNIPTSGQLSMTPAPMKNANRLLDTEVASSV